MENEPLADQLRPVWASFYGSPIRHKIFVPEKVDIGVDSGAFIAGRTAAEELYSRGSLPEGRFPVHFFLFRSVEDTEPANRVTVYMEVKPVFFVVRGGEEK